MPHLGVHRRRTVIAAIALGLSALLLAATPMATAVAAGGWGWPVRGPVLTRFHLGPDPFARGQRRGISIGAQPGAAVRSACRGIVRFAGTVGDAGRTVSVACAAGLTATYLHLGDLVVGRGRAVGLGEPIGTVGRSGRPALAASHLQFGVHQTGRRWAYVDPLSLLQAPPGWVSPVSLAPGRRPGPVGPPPEPAAPISLGYAPQPATPAPALTSVLAPVQAPAVDVPVAAAGARAPAVVWIGAALLVLSLPGWGLRGSTRRRRRSAHRAGDPHPGTGAPMI